MNDDTQRRNKHSSILSALRSDNERKVLGALEATADHGNENMVLPLLELFRDSKSPTVRERAHSLLSSLKISGAEEVLIEALDGNDFFAQRADILFFLWHSGFQPSDSVDVIVRVSLAGDYMTAVEGLTLLESLSHQPDEESLYQALIEVRNYLDAHKDSKHELFALGLSIFDVLARYERE